MVVGSNMVRNKLDRKSRKAQSIKYGKKTNCVWTLAIIWGEGGSGGERGKKEKNKYLTTF